MTSLLATFPMFVSHFALKGDFLSFDLQQLLAALSMGADGAVGRSVWTSAFPPHPTLLCLPKLTAQADLVTL